MKTTEIAQKYGVEHDPFREWIKASNYHFKTTLMGSVDVDDGQNIDLIVQRFKKEYAEHQQRQAEAQAEAARAQAEKQAALASILITSGFSFDGYTITKYSGYISGDDAVQIDRGMDGFFGQATDVGEALMASLVHIRRNALMELKEAALALGCNAVIGVDFDYLTLDPETANSSGGTTYMPYVFGVTANGNAVVIEEAAGRGSTQPPPPPASAGSDPGAGR